ncbi:MAG: hypothetical protein C0404_06075 [Verrucomicrobia bacterium]|nr:hypothetical protein [Verrucomicrobiota bacterium]
MRTTLVIDEPVYQRACENAKRDHKRLSELVTEAVECYLLSAEPCEAKRSLPRRLKTYAMGEPSVDLNNRDEVYRRMED